MVAHAEILMKRRDVLLAAGAVLAMPFASAQQAPKVYRIGLLSPTSPNPAVEAFRQGLREHGYVEGKNVILETRFAEGRSERIPKLVAELLQLKVEVLMAASSPGVLAAKKATSSVPIVFAGVIDPIALNVVASLAHPGGNITGATWGVGGTGFSGKWVELLKEVVPAVSRVAVLSNSSNPTTAAIVRDIDAAARALKVTLDVLDAGNAAKLDRALAAIGESGAQGIIVTNDPFFFFNENRAKLVQYAARKRLPALYFTSHFVDAGGLISYGGSLEDSFRRAASYVDKILRGAKPADLPIDQPTRFELVINMRTAKALGLTIPGSLLLRADRVIE
jgi:putative ABC transport system substrate-binding protein